MARSFNGSTQYLQIDAASIYTPVLTLAAWVYSSSTTADQTAVFYGDRTVDNNYLSLGLGGAITGDPAFFVAKDGARTQNARSTSGYSANTWHLITGVVNSATSNTVYLDGGNADNGTSLSQSRSDNRMSIGRLSSSAPTELFTGRIAEVAAWEVALTAAEVARLYTGRRTMNTVRPQNMMFYYRLLAGDQNRNYAGVDTFGYFKGKSLTAVGVPGDASGVPNLVLPGSVI